MSWLIEWLRMNATEIIVVLTSGTFVTVCGFLWNLVSNGKLLKENNLNNKALNNNIGLVNDTKISINKTNDEIVNLSNKIANMERYLKGFVSILGIVYSRSKDEDIRNAVAVITNTLNSEEGSIIADLQKEIAELKSKLSVKIENTEIVTENVTENELTNSDELIERG